MAGREGGLGVTPGDNRGVGGSGGAGIDSRDVPGDPAPLAGCVQLPGTGDPGFGAGDFRFCCCFFSLQNLLARLENPSQFCSRAPNVTHPPSPAFVPCPRGRRGQGGAVPTPQGTQPVPSPAHTDGAWEAPGAKGSPVGRGQTQRGSGDEFPTSLWLFLTGKPSLPGGII